VDGRLLLVVHGDEFDGVTRCHRWIALTGDMGYEMLLVLNRWFNVARRSFGLPYWSLSAYVKGKVKRAVNFVTAFEQALAHEASRRGLQGVVCGHIHRAEMRELGGILYCNTGDWVESCTALAEASDGTLELLKMLPAMPEAIVARPALT
jgi:UDP-2,3-diacylglucosamine pyrophosphatase LpxH